MTETILERTGSSQFVTPEDISCRLPWKAGGDPTFLIDREWLVTNGMGGYASGTIYGVPTRRYHGYLIPNLPAPQGRTVLIPRLDESVSTGVSTFKFGGAAYGDRHSDVETEKFLAAFRVEWMVPCWTFNFGDCELEKRVLMPDGQSSVYIEYRLVRGKSVTLRVRPYFTFRGHDESLAPAPNSAFAVRYEHQRIEVLPFEGAPRIKLALQPEGGSFVLDGKKDESIFLSMEELRGLDAHEKVTSPGYFAVTLETGASACFVAGLESWENLHKNFSDVSATNEKRLRGLIQQAPAPAQSGVAAQLVLASDQFVIFPGSRADEKAELQNPADRIRTVVAGYHWFTDWGRDTMISLEGLALCTRRYGVARDILRTFSHYVHQGLLPNHFPEGQRTAIYNTVDATLWYFHALDRYLRYTSDQETLRYLYPTLKTIIDHYQHGTLFGIGEDPSDGLIRQGADGYALTWMDAKVEDWVVTPRRGKPVEIQALWYNALMLMSEWAKELGDHQSFDVVAHQVKESFNKKFWFEGGGFLYDVIDGEKGPDSALRPNQIFSISLTHPVLDTERWAPVLGTIERRLLTPVGLRTLDPRDENYKYRYEGSRWARDAAYHQGLVWPWLIGHYWDAHRKLNNGDPGGTLQWLSRFEQHLTDGCVGTISEIFDAEPPFTPRGCIAQAWSVAEVLRLLIVSGPSSARNGTH